MTSGGIHAFSLALVFLLTALGLLVYKKANPENRTDLVMLGASRCVMCAAAFAVSGGAKVIGFESYRLQALSLAPVNLAIILVISAICTTQARSYGTVDISPKARAILRHSKRVFILTFGVSMVLSLWWPVPVQEDFTPAPAILLLDRALVTFPEMVFPAVAAFVSFQATRVQEPVGRIRLQQACLFIAHVFIAMIGVSTFSAVCFMVFVETDELRREWIELTYMVDVVILIIIVIAYLLGLFLYYVGDDRAHTITRFNRWRRVRGSWEHDLRRLDDKSVGEWYPEYENIKYAASELAERSIQEGQDETFVYDANQKAQRAFKLLTVVASPVSGVDKAKDSELLTLIKYHERLVRDPSTSEMSWQIIDGSEREFSFDLRTDPLLEIAKRVRQFLHDSNSSTHLVSQPQWFQLAVLASAKAGVLREDKAARIRDGKAVMDRVSRAYDNAGILGTMYGSSAPAQRSIAPNRHFYPR